jgi:hypothetical protein
MTTPVGFHEPPPVTDEQSTNPNDRNWLPLELERELEAAAPMPDDIDENGFIVNFNRLEEVAGTLFFKGRVFYNWYQAKDFHNKFGNMWGFVGTTEGFSMFCSFGKANKKRKVSPVSPSVQRIVTTSIKEINCPWKIKFSSADPRASRILVNVKISSVALLGHKCKPGKLSLTVVKKAAGQYVLFLHVVQALMTFIDSGPVSPSTLRQFVRKYMPAQVEISSQDFCDFARPRKVQEGKCAWILRRTRPPNRWLC